MSNKHTPGPWAISEQNDTNKSWKFEVYSTITDTGVTRVGYFDTERDEDFANARLIAAAPELLEALEAALCWLPAFYEQNAVDNGGIGNSVLARRINEARTAIAKAKGEE